MKKLPPISKINIMKLLRIERYGKQAIYICTIGLFIFANLIISFVPLRLDFSNGQAYTLSNASKKVVSNLDDIVNIKLYVSSDLPSRMLPVRTDVIDLMNEYSRESRGKLALQIIDPKKDENTAREVREAGIPEIQFSQIEGDKFAVSTSFFGAVISYGKKQEVIPQVTDAESLEYNVTASIYKMTAKESVTVGSVNMKVDQTQGRPSASFLTQILQQQYPFQPVDLATASGEIDPKTYKSVMVFDDNEKHFDQYEVDKLKKYLNNKGQLIVFADGVWVRDTLMTDDANHNLFGLLSEYGLTLNKDLVLSTVSEVVNFGSQDLFSFLSPYPFWIRTNQFAKDVPYVANVRSLTLPWTSSIKLEQKAGYESKSIIESVKTSWHEDTSFKLSPRDIVSPVESEYNQYVVGAQSINKNGGKIILIPSSRFVLDRYFSRNSNNLDLVLNAVNEMVSGGALTGIRARSVNIYPITNVPQNQHDFLKYVVIFLLPVLFALFGAYRLVKRK